jgi:methyl-accepting chemotaxis protein
MVISNGMVVNKNGQLFGVAASDIVLADMTESLKEYKLGQTGELIVISPSGLLITHPNPEVVGLQIRDKGVISNIGQEQGNFEYTPNKDLEPEPEFSEELSEARGALGLSTEPPVLVEGEDRFAYYMKTDLGWTVVATIEESEVLAEARSVLVRIAIIGLLSVLVAVVLSMVFSRKLSGRMKTILQGTEKIKDGDFTTEFHVKSSDEMNMLAEYMDETVQALGTMMKGVKMISSEVSEAATTLAATSEEASASADEVSRTVEEIAKGASSQASDTETSATITYSLAEKFEVLNDNTKVMIESTQQAIEANTIGTEKIGVLSESAAASGEASLRIGKSIAELNNQTKDIDSILEAITGIAEQTNLLALNASIEAARAGEHGRGFAVVADEIRKLAEESNQSAEQIRVIVNNIQRDSEKTVAEMAAVEDITKEQTSAVEEMSKSFKTISSSIEAIASKIDAISTSVGELTSDKDNLVMSIQNISAVSQQTAAGAQQVSAATEQQRIAVGEVAQSAEFLNEISLKLNEELDKFKLE